MRLAAAWTIFKTAVNDWLEDRAPRLGAALAYYTVFSLAPLLVIAVAVGGLVFGDDAAQGRLAHELEGLLGADGAKAVEGLIKNTAMQSEKGHLATALGIAALVFGATGVFSALKDALNTIWEVEPKPGQTIKVLIRDRLLSFAMVGCIAFLLLVSLVAGAVVGAASTTLADIVEIPSQVFFAIDWVLTLVMTTALFAALFKVLPDAKIAWREVWFGAVVTAVLFTIGKVLIGLYLGNAAVASAYGAAGSLVIVLLWTYYSSQILLFGAELTQAHAKYRGVEILPSKHARRVTAAQRAQQGTGAAKPSLM